MSLFVSTEKSLNVSNIASFISSAQVVLGGFKTEIFDALHPYHTHVNILTLVLYRMYLHIHQ